MFFGIVPMFVLKDFVRGIGNTLNLSNLYSLTSPGRRTGGPTSPVSPAFTIHHSSFDISSFLQPSILSHQLHIVHLRPQGLLSSLLEFLWSGSRRTTSCAASSGCLTKWPLASFSSLSAYQITWEGLCMMYSLVLVHLSFHDTLS